VLASAGNCHAQLVPAGVNRSISTRWEKENEAIAAKTSPRHDETQERKAVTLEKRCIE
jgi:hypothetical protein